MYKRVCACMYKKECVRVCTRESVRACMYKRECACVYVQERVCVYLQERVIVCEEEWEEEWEEDWARVEESGRECETDITQRVTSILVCQCFLLHSKLGPQYLPAPTEALGNNL